MMNDAHVGRYVKLVGEEDREDSVFAVKHLKGESLGTIEVKDVGDSVCELAFDITADKNTHNEEYYVEALELAESHAFKHTEAHVLILKNKDKDMDLEKYAKEAGFYEEEGKLLIHSHNYSDVRN